MKNKNDSQENALRDCPSTRVLKLEATPEEVARRIFTNAKPPATSKQESRKWTKPITYHLITAW